MSEDKAAEDATEIIKQAFAELDHCVQAGPAWFTKGEWGQKEHAREWARRGLAAIAVLEKSRSREAR